MAGIAIDAHGLFERGKPIAPRLTEMRAKWGSPPAGARCKHCVKCYSIGRNGKYLKCALYGESHGAATDWRANWTGCGAFERREATS